jgi:hypothetical protein
MGSGEVTRYIGKRNCARAKAALIGMLRAVFVKAADNPEGGCLGVRRHMAFARIARHS